MAKTSLLDFGVLILIGLTAARANGIIHYLLKGNRDESAVGREKVLRKSSWSSGCFSRAP